MTRSFDRRGQVEPPTAVQPPVRRYVPVNADHVLDILMWVLAAVPGVGAVALVGLIFGWWH